MITGNLEKALSTGGSFVGKLKLLVTASTFPRWENDTEPRFVLDLCKAMTEYFDITVLVPACPGAKECETLEGVKVIRYHYFPIHKFETLCYPGAIVPRIKQKKVRALLVPFLFIGLWNALRKHVDDYDFVHAHWLIPQGIVQSFFDKPYIVTGHGGDVCSLNNGLTRKLKIKCIKKAKHITVVSEHLKGKILELVPGAKVDVISMGVDTSAFGPQYRVKNYFGQGDKKVVLFVGRLAEKKGVTYLIETMRYIDAKLVIVGDGPLRNELLDQAKALALQEEQEISSSYCFPYKFGKIEFLGSKTHKELKTIFASADILCIPSITAKNGDKEGMPTVLFEAMASGIPVIATTSSSIGQILSNGESCLLCEEKSVHQLTEKIVQLLDDPLMYHQIVEKASLKAVDNSYSRKGNQFSKLIGLYKK